MFTLRARSVALVAILFLTLAPLAASAESVTFTIAVKSVFGRSGPGFTGTTRLASLFTGQAFPVTGRTTDSSWVHIDLGGWPGEVWVLVDYGTVKGDLSAVPAVAEAETTSSTSASTTTTTAPPPGNGGLLPPTKVKITIGAKAIYVRSGPSTDATPIASAFKGQTFFIRARNADATWVQLDFAGAKAEAWVRVDTGTITGRLEGVPVPGTQPAALAETPVTTLAPGGSDTDNPLGFSASALANARAIARTGRRLGVNARAFSRVGDSNSESSSFLADFDGGVFDLGGFGYLQSAVNQFSGSFRRTGAAVQGFTSWGVTNPVYADPRLCRSTESALVCELRLQKPVVVLVMIGTNDVWVQGSTPSEPYLRQIVQNCIDRGAVPVMSTLAWNPKSSYYPAALAVNDAIRKVAKDMNVPLWDFYQSAQSLPGQGIGDYSWDPHAHLSSEPGGQAYIFRDPFLQAGLTRHNLEALQALYTIWLNVIAQ